MRWVHVTDTFLPKIGGAEIAIDQLVRAMTARGDACAVLAQRPKGLAGEIEVPYRLNRFSNPRSSRWAGWWIERHLDQLVKDFGRPDVLIGHHAFPPGYAGVSYGKRHGIPTIVYPRGGDIYEVSRFRRKKHAWRKLAWALANASAVVCASEAMEKIVHGIIGPSTSQRIERIPNGVDVDELRRDASTSRFAADPEFEGPFVLGLGRAIRRKGFHLLIDAFASIANTDWRLVIAGDGRELPPLQQQAEPLGDRVRFAGLVEGADKRWLLQHCQFMAAPSIEESFGNVALEAMACGKPVVASRASGFAEIVKDRANGRLVDVGDVASLAEALREMMSCDLSAISSAASQTAQSFAWTSIAQRYDDLARSLIHP